MRDDQDGAIEPNQPTLEPEHGVKVKVIRRFIQQQQVGRGHQDSGQIEAHFPAPRERIDGFFMILGRKSKPVEKLCGPGWCAPSVKFVELAMQLRDPPAFDRGILGRAVQLKSSQFAHDCIATGVRTQDMFNERM